MHPSEQFDQMIWRHCREEILYDPVFVFVLNLRTKCAASNRMNRYIQHMYVASYLTVLDPVFAFLIRLSILTTTKEFDFIVSPWHS